MVLPACHCEVRSEKRIQCVAVARVATHGLSASPQEGGLWCGAMSLFNFLLVVAATTKRKGLCLARSWSVGRCLGPPFSLSFT